MSSDKVVRGVYAALLVPRDPSGGIDEPTFRGIVEFLARSGLNRLVLNGATGEYWLTSLDEFRRMARICRETLGAGGEFLAAIGSAGIHGSLALAQAAQEQGAKAVLLPMPHCIPYSQTDLCAWCSEVARRAGLPVLLYNLPAFTTPLHADTACTLIGSVPNIIGIKDSGGTLDILPVLDPSACRILGHDGLLVEALERNVCDGVISGIACVLPELVTSVWDGRGGAGRLNELVAQLSTMPVPWALKWLAQARGIAPARFAQPLSQERRRQGEALVSWFREWTA